MGCMSSRAPGSRGGVLINPAADADSTSGLPLPPRPSPVTAQEEEGESLAHLFPNDTLLSLLPRSCRDLLAEHLFGTSRRGSRLVGPRPLCLRSPFECRYCLSQDGASLDTLYRRLRKPSKYLHGPVVLLFSGELGEKDDLSQPHPPVTVVVGVYLSEPLTPSEQVSGDGTTFVFTYTPTNANANATKSDSEEVDPPPPLPGSDGLRIYPCRDPCDSGFASTCYALCSEDSLRFGLSEEHGTCCVRLDRDLCWCESGLSDTFVGNNSASILPSGHPEALLAGCVVRMRVQELQLLCKSVSA